MIVVAITGLIAVVFAQLEALRKISFGFVLSYILITFVQAVHFDFGNDYMSYMYQFKAHVSGSLSLLKTLEYIEFRDSGWLVMESLFKSIGFFGLVACLSIFQNSVYFYFIRKYVPQKFIGLAVFAYIFDPNLYLLNMSMLRQGFAEAIFFLAFMFVLEKNKKNYIIAVFLVLFAGSIHSSSFMMLPFLLWPMIPMKDAKKMIPILLITFVICRFSSSILENIIRKILLFQQFSRFDIYSGVSGSGGGFGFALFCVPSIALLMFLNKSSNEKFNQIISFALFEKIIVPFAAVIMIVSRMVIYFSQFYIIAIPIALCNLKEKGWFYFFMLYFIMVRLYQYFSFFASSTYSRYYANYHSIFEVFLQ